MDGLKYSHITTPEALRKLSVAELHEFAAELRAELIDTITQVGGHLAPSLGVVELTIALHRVFNTPRDKIVWDVGHQAYVHKMLTGRRDRLHTIRQFGGLSGFLKRNESEYDVFGAGHASTSISAAFGIACARDLANEDYKVIAVIGDGAMTGGLAYEALNNAGISGKNMLVILNDNNMSISPNVGAISNYLVDILTNRRYRRLRDEIWDFTNKLPVGRDIVRHIGKKVEDGMIALATKGMLFEDLGFQYVGPVNGNDLEKLLSTLESVSVFNGPVLLHIQTQKGKGWDKAEADPVKYHGVKAGTPSPNSQSYATPLQAKPPSTEAPDTIETDVKPNAKDALSYMDAFGAIMIEQAEANPKVLAITAAMSEGTGLTQFAEKFPRQFFDVGIAEAHGVCFAAGLATQGYRPVCAIYSTFLQRAFDQIVHDVATQHLPVIFCLDRAGLVGEDGPTHHGTLDLSYLSLIQEMIVACPKDGDELRDLLTTALYEAERPFAIRYPKESSVVFTLGKAGKVLPIGSWEEHFQGSELTVLATGSMYVRAEQTVTKLRSEGHSIGLVNARFVKPVDANLLVELSLRTKRIVTIEENVPAGGLITHVRNALAELSCAPTVTAFTLPDRFIEHGKREELLDLVGLSAREIERRLRSLLLEIPRKPVEIVPTIAEQHT
ncbi:MAG: 1-deoxy-D-xylulose-5-phosphate synthase [bacterium]|nr:1-deoxy-D-xylulose-5-phosphate synthase [bacterium]